MNNESYKLELPNDFRDKLKFLLDNTDDRDIHFEFMEHNDDNDPNNGRLAVMFLSVTLCFPCDANFGTDDLYQSWKIPVNKLRDLLEKGSPLDTVEFDGKPEFK